jgi:hypothetical protein
MCQLQSIDSLSQRNSWLNDKMQFGIRKYRFYKKTILRTFRPVTRPSSTLMLYQDSFRPGDWVRILPKKQIQPMLDRFRKTQGCTFQIEMYDHCGREYQIFKKVDHFFDETKQKLCKCNNLYLLDGCFCSGSTAYLKSCDRNCYFFWHSDWLERIDNIRT